LRFLVLLAALILNPLNSLAEVRGIQGVFTQPFQFFLQPGVETGFGVGDLSGRTGLHVSPKVYTRLKIELDGMYFAPDIGLGVMTGLNSSHPSFLSAGFIAGFREPPPSIGFYGGLITDSFFGADQPTGISGRVGIDIDYRVSGAQFFTELRVGTFFHSPGGVAARYLLIGIHAGLQFLIEI
jgi:hypothetical protein